MEAIQTVINTAATSPLTPEQETIFYLQAQQWDDIHNLFEQETKDGEPQWLDEAKTIPKLTKKCISSMIQ